MRLLERVVAADQPGQHAGIGRLRLAADQRQSHAGLRAHGEPAQHLDMGVAGAQQDEVGRDRRAGLHSREPSPLAASWRSGEDRGMTWSILVRDPATGALGAAVATRFFAVGALAIHVEGGVAALATQALINPMYASAGMARLRAGEAPDAVASALLAEDAGRDHRQLHMIDARGRIAQWTGGDCVAWCGAVRGADISVAGNMLAGAAVVERTLDAFQRAAGTLAERLITALEAGEAAGGDKRGKQSAALKICTRDAFPDLDIRTDDHPDPLGELRRLYAVSQERFAVFRRFLAGADSPCGVFDRAVIDAAIARDGRPPT